MPPESEFPVNTVASKHRNSETERPLWMRKDRCSGGLPLCNKSPQSCEASGGHTESHSLGSRVAQRWGFEACRISNEPWASPPSWPACGTSSPRWLSTGAQGGLSTRHLHCLSPAFPPAQLRVLSSHGWESEKWKLARPRDIWSYWC